MCTTHYNANILYILHWDKICVWAIKNAENILWIINTTVYAFWGLKCINKL